MGANDVQDQKIKSLEKRVEMHDKAINGNGQKGLKQVAEATSAKVGILLWFVGAQTGAMIGVLAKLLAG